MGTFGDGTDGELVFTTTTKSYGNMTLDVEYSVSGNTLYLYDRAYNFTSMNLGTGTILTLHSSVTTKTSLVIYCNDSATIAGSVRLDAATTSITTREGGAGGSGGKGGGSSWYSGGNGASQGNGYGGGGGGGGTLAWDDNGATGGSGGTGSSSAASGGDRRICCT